MRCVIRADASIHLGVGHVMRCLTLARQICNQVDAEIHFICRDESGHIADLIAEQGYRVVLLPKKKNGLTSSSSKEDAREVLNNFPVEMADWLVVDHYQIDACWEKMLRSRAKNILVIDDLANRPHDCDVLLDQNYRFNLERRYDRLVPVDCTKLLGPSHLLLRSEFINARKIFKREYSTVRRILVNFGGTDELNLSMLAVKAILSLQLSNVLVDVVVGKTNPHQALLVKEISTLAGFELHVQTNRMAELICAADLAIGANGSSTWERCSLGLPSLALVLAANQRDTARELSEAGIIINLGEAKDISIAVLATELDSLIKDQARRMSLSGRSLELVPLSQQLSIPKLMMQKMMQKSTHHA